MTFTVIMEIRQIRDGILSATDWTQTIDSPLSDADKLKWQTFRQELRDLPAKYANASSILDVVFPERPDQAFLADQLKGTMD
jgi:hypothetical protein